MKGFPSENGQAGEQDVDDGFHSQRHPPDDDAVEHEPEVDGLDAAQHGSGLAVVAHLDEFDVREHAAAPPEAGEEENGQDAPEGEIPPEPVTRDTVLGHEFGDGQGGIRCECSGHHGGAGQPPGHIPSRQEEFGSIPPGPPEIIHGDPEREREISCYENPVERGKEHDISGKVSVVG